MILFMKGTGTVVVNVDNENDHAPFCVQSTGIFSVSENAGMNNRLYDFVISHCNVLSNKVKLLRYLTIKYRTATE